MTNVNSIGEFLKSFEMYMANVQWAKHPIELYDPVAYILSIGGKRLRPITLLYLVDILKGDKLRALDAAYGIELFHNFSLVHDDIMDASEKRRSFDTVHVKFGQNEAILSGDLMLIESIAYIHKAEGGNSQINLMDLFLVTAREVCEGQSMDMSFEIKLNVSLDEYLEMIRLKTAVLLACCFSMAARISEREALADKLYDLGIQIGMAFQLEDDWLDYYSENPGFGKTKGGDILRAKKSALILELCESMNLDDRKEFLEKYVSGHNPEKRLEEVAFKLNQHSVKEKLKQRISTYKHKAYAILSELTITDEQKNALKHWVQLILDRSH